MRSIWKGAISFGLVAIPVRLYVATESHTLPFRQIHTADGGRIRYRKVCELDGQEVSAEEIGRAYEATTDDLVPLTDEDLARLPLPTARTIELLAVVGAETVDPLQIDRAYYVGADGRAAAKPYVLLREALARRQAVAMVKVALRSRESLAMLRVHDDAIVMHTLLWPDEIRAPIGVAPRGEVPLRDAELGLADTLMDALGEMSAEDLTDHYQEAVEQLVNAKLEGRELAGVGPGPGRVVDLMAALEDSVRAAREARGEEAQVHQLTEHRQGAKKTTKTAKKTAKKTRKKRPAS